MSQIMMRKTVNAGHRVAIPKDIWYQMGWHEGTVLEFWQDGEIVCMKKVQSNVDALNHLCMFHWDIANMGIPQEQLGRMSEHIEALKKEITEISMNK